MMSALTLILGYSLGIVLFFFLFLAALGLIVVLLFENSNDRR